MATAGKTNLPEEPVRRKPRVVAAPSPYSEEGDVPDYQASPQGGGGGGGGGDPNGGR